MTLVRALTLEAEHRARGVSALDRFGLSPIRARHSIQVFGRETNAASGIGDCVALGLLFFNL